VANAEVLHYLRDTPKVELHVHLEGAVRPARLLRILRRHALHSHLQREEDLAFLFRHANFAEFLQHFRFVVTCIRDVQDVHDVAQDLFEDLAAQNVHYAEVIFSAAIFTRMGLPLGELLAAVTEAADRTPPVAGPRFNFVVDVVRNFGADAALRSVGELVQAAHPRVVGIHLGGDEIGFPARDFAPAFARAHEAGLGCAAHAGEAGGPESVRDAVEVLGVQRIGHGVRAVEDAGLLAQLAACGITLEVCPTSNVRTGVVADYAAHPLPALLGAGIAVTLGADDPAYFHTDLTRELQLAVEHWGLDADAADEFAAAGLRAAFAPEPDRTARLAAWSVARDQIRALHGLPVPRFPRGAGGSRRALSAPWR